MRHPHNNGGITSDNKLMNLCEIGLFHIVRGVSKVPVIIIIIFGENNVLCPKYINICHFGRYGRDVHLNVLRVHH